MSQLNAERKTLEVLAEEFVARYRRGERPALAEYIDAHPELAGEIRELFPTLVMMEELAPSDSGSAVPSTAAPTQPPRLSLGDYRILREIGRGGMGIVYEAEQLSLGRRVALKVLRQAVGDATVRQRFHREARAAAQLHHTNIVPVFEVGEDHDACWYAMQLILGQGLDQIIEELRPLRTSAASRTNAPPACPQLSQVTQALVSGKFVCPGLDSSTPPPALMNESSEQASFDSTDSVRLASRSELSAGDSAGGPYYRSVARIGRQAAEALAHAHARGIIHRDIKPSNLLLDTAGVVWITDFGLAKTHDSALTTTGDIVGTVRYMAPERLQGEGDERGDVYALGLTLYELLVLRPAFDACDRLQLIDRIKNQEPVRPRSLDRRIPRDLETIILKSIDKEAKRRYQTAEALAEDLRRFLANEPIQARRTSALERGRMWCRRNPALAGLYLVLFLAALCSTLFAVYLGALLERSEAERKQKKQAERQAKERLWDSYLSQAQARRFSRRQGQRFESLNALQEAFKIARELDMPAARLDQLRNEAIACLTLPDLRVVREWDAWPEGTTRVDVDPAFERYARMDRQGRCIIHRVGDGAEIGRLPGIFGPECWPEWSPDGRTLYVANLSGHMWLYRMEGAEPVLLLDESRVKGCYSPDGLMFVLGTADGRIRLIELPSGRPLQQLKTSSFSGSFVCNPSQRQLALLHDATSIQILDLDSGKVLTTIQMPSRVMGLAWHPDGTTLAVVGTDEKIRLWDVPTQKPGWVLEGHKNGGILLTFNHAGDLLASVDFDSILRLWDLHTGQQVFQMQAVTFCDRFSKDDRLLPVHKGNKMAICEVAFGRTYRTLARRSTLGKAKYYQPALSPDGRLLAVGMDDGVGLWDQSSGKQLEFLKLGTTFHVTFEPSGALLTNGDIGLLRWPIKTDPTSAGRLRIGPPERLPLPGSHCQVAQSHDGSVLASAQHSGALVWHRDGTNRIIRLGPHADVRGVAVSPDGRWVATASHNGTGIKIWDTQTGKLVKELLPDVGGASVGFSPDGRWLATHCGGVSQLWAVDSWLEGPRLGRFFSPDSNFLVAPLANGVLRLMRLEDGRELARLEDPNQDETRSSIFSSDGAQFVTTNTTTGSIHVWDLRAIRKELADMGLDWEAPPYPALEKGPTSEPLRLGVDLGTLGADLAAADPAQIGLNSFFLALCPFNHQAYLNRGRTYARQGDSPKAIDDYSMVLTLLPADHPRRAEVLLRRASNYARLDDLARTLADAEQLSATNLVLGKDLVPAAAKFLNEQAWRCATGPEKERDPRRAVILARKAVEMMPDESLYLNTLGVAYYRAGKYAEAIGPLEASLRTGRGEFDAFDLFFLAMCHHQLGDAAKAKDCRERGASWFAKHKGQLTAEWVRELTAFQAESDAVLAQPPDKRTSENGKAGRQSQKRPVR